MATVDLKEVQQKLYERLKPSGWGDKLKTFVLGEEFHKILTVLLAESNSGKKFTPVMKDLFRAFEECPYTETRIVMLGQDPYPGANTADGIAFSCSKSEKPAASLKFIHKEIKQTVYPNREYVPKNDLSYLSKQGILLINTALTTSINEVGSHMLLWRPFIAFLLDTLVFDGKQRIYVFMGAKAKDWGKSVPVPNYKFFTLHPAAAAHSHTENWDSGDMFNQVNTVLKSQFGKEIVW